MIEYHVHIRSTDQFKQVGVREKMTVMRSIVGGSPYLTMHLRNHLIITSGYPFWYIDSVGPGLIFQDDYNARLHNHEYFHERNAD